jgi:phosphate transport system permease protein
MTSAAHPFVVADARRRLRAAKDLAARALITAGGIAVIVAIVLIFFYLLKIVLPLFRPASMDTGAAYPVPGPADATLHLALEERGVLAARYTARAEAVFFSTGDGKVVERVSLVNGPATATAALGVSDLAGNGVVIGLDDGRIVPARVEYRTSYAGGERRIEPSVEFPLGRAPLTVDPRGRAVVAVAGDVGTRDARFVSVLADGTVMVTHAGLTISFLTGETTVSGAESRELPVRLGRDEVPAYALLSPTQEWLYLADESGDAAVLRRRGEDYVLNERLRLAAPGERLTSLAFLTGGISLLAGTDRGHVLQWFPVRDAGNEYRLQHVRTFDGPRSPVTAIAPEHRRKGFAVAHADGTLGVHFTTSGRTLLERRVSDAPLPLLAFGPRADLLLALTGDGRALRFDVANEHPEISWSALFGKVWYESYPEPDHVWQSSSASNEFEPKLSLTPLSFGTLKAAFYAMLVAMPLAILGAIYTAYFMRPALRRLVKPTVEVMEALPTVILGFLAGLWLAPLLEAKLAAVLLFVLLVPAGTVLSGRAWQQVPAALRNRVPPGLEPALLVLPVVAFGWLAFALGPPLETAFFGGNLPHWLSSTAGIDYSQRNALVVGIAMGFAVIPVIFSIAEDAVFAVPKHLSNGSLALGATPWQTLVRVVLPTASPGIFSAIMIGLGRAVGETMIVLMATGNTPVMDWNIFEGMRTLSANIAVEMPESELNSTHYRVLFLAALVLFLLTFVFNTGAEIVRQRLRRRYGAL